MIGAISIAEKSKDPNLTAVSVMVGEIVGLAAQKSAVPSVEKPFIAQKAAMDRQLQIKMTDDIAKSYANGNTDAWAGWEPESTIYIAFSETPDDFRHEPKYRLITTEGALGQPLGEVMPSWPNKDD